jgi:hypothetical protein
MRKSTLTVPVYIFFLLISILTIGLPYAAAAAQSRSAGYFSSGQAVYDPQDRAKSRQQAVQDFMAQGLTQAISAFLSPTQMGTQFAEIQKKVLSKPEKFIDSYQVFSEEQTGGVFRVVGQVTVSMDVLQDDLVKSGLLTSRQRPEGQPASSPGISAPSGTSKSEDVRDEEDEQSSEEPNESSGTPASEKAPHPGPVTAGEGNRSADSQAPAIEQGAPGPSSRGIAATKKEILWAVPEKWEQEWVLPTDSEDVRTLFTRSLGKEADDFGLSILLPQPGSVRMDLAGNIPPSQAISLAEGLGVQDVVVGKVSYSRDRNSRQVLLDANLRVIRIAQGKSEFELHRTQIMEELSNQEGATGLAKRIAPQLSSLIGGPSTGHRADGSAQGPQATPEQAGNLGPLLIYVPSAQYSCWMELEKILREQFKNMQRAGFEIGPTESAVRLDGVSGDYVLKMSGTKLPSGAAIHIDSYSTETQTMKMSFAPPEKVQTETR